MMDQQQVIKFEFDTETRTLRLVHPLIGAEWQWNERGGVGCTRLAYLPSGTEWIAPEHPAPLYVLRFTDDQQHKHAWSQQVLTLLGTEAHHNQEPPLTRVSNDVAESVVQMSPTNVPIAITCHLQSHINHAVIRQWVEVKNTGPQPVVITQLPILTWRVDASVQALRAHCGLERRHFMRHDEWPDWFTWRAVDLGPGVVDRVESGYRREATWLGLTSADDGPALYLGWETNCEAACDFGDLHGDGAISAECSIQPQYILQPGQTLPGAAGFTGLAAGDLDEVSYRCQRFVEDVLAWQVDDDCFPYVAFNSWGYGADIDDASMRHCFEICRKLGVELFVVDFGWEDPDWRPLRDRFPQGLAPLADAAHAAGMRFGIHLSFGNVSSLSNMYAVHPEWANGPGQWAYRQEGEVFGLTLGNPLTQDWIVEKLVQIIDDNKIDYWLYDHYLWGPINPEQPYS